MTGALLLTGALMGLAGTPHCVSMCAAGCAAAAKRCAPQSSGRALAALLLGRLLAYAAAGAVAASVIEGARWFVDGTGWLKPIWTMLQLALLLLGVWLLLRGRLPPTIEAWAEQLGRPPVTGQVQKIHLPGELKAFGLGTLWPALPCGLLHAALLVAAVASGPIEGAGVMAAFGATSSLALVIGPALWLRLLRGGSAAGAATLNPAWAIRMAGAAIVVAVGWSMGHALLTDLAPAWCA
ncbi:MAG: sulfite exporter TauE/SafE family protein [Leptothrix sp. (in: b-proteobacteria)]